MQKIVTQILIDNIKYYKVINAINDNIVHINIYRLSDSGLVEVFPDDVDIGIRGEILRRDNQLSVPKQEAMDLLNIIESMLIKSRHAIIAMLEDYYNEKIKIKLLSSFAGINYCIVEFKDKLFYEVFQVFIKEAGKVKNFSTLQPGLVEILVADIASKLSINNEVKYIQLSNNKIYGLKQEGETVAFVEIEIKKDNFKCIKAYGLKRDRVSKRLYSFEEKTFELTEKIHKMCSTVEEDLILKLYQYVMQKSEQLNEEITNNDAKVDANIKKPFKCDISAKAKKHIDPLNLYSIEITNEKIFERLKEIVEFKDSLYEQYSVKDMLELLCLRNNYELSEMDKENILKKLK